MKEKIVDQLLRYFIKEDGRFENLEIPSGYIEKRSLLREIINIRNPRPTSEDILKLEDELLQLEIETIEDCISIWQGNITTLKVDAIVNPGNSAC